MTDFYLFFITFCVIGIAYAVGCIAITAVNINDRLVEIRDVLKGKKPTDSAVERPD